MLIPVVYKLELDGNIYFESWDPMIIPPSQDEPMDYRPVKPMILDSEATIEAQILTL